LDAMLVRERRNATRRRAWSNSVGAAGRAEQENEGQCSDTMSLHAACSLCKQRDSVAPAQDTSRIIRSGA
jgi:hypothetical protein